MFKKFNAFKKVLPSYYDNVLDAFIPELWAQEGLAILEENMVVGNLVHRDFSAVIAAYGDIVNTRKPGEFKAKRKTDADSVTIQNATATNIAVKLDQHIHVSFMIKDGEESLAFQELTQIYLRPAVLAMARQIDRAIIGQGIRFRKYCAGGLGTLSSSNAADYIIDTRTKMNTNKVLEDMNRQLILSTISEGVMLKDSQFTDANRVGDDGTALREASLGRKFGFNIFMAQNTPHVNSGNTAVTGAINHSGGYNAGTSTFVVNGLSAAITAGTWITIAGDDTPLQVVSTVGGSTPTSITTDNPITNAVANSAVVTVYSTGWLVNNSSGYSAGYVEDISIDTGSDVGPQLGQPVSFGTNYTDVYVVTDTDGSTYISLDRPLVADVADDAVINLGPPGDYNFAFHRTAIAFVNRPLALPRAGMGALAANVNFNNLGMRVVMQYDGDAQGTRVTVDMLAGVAQLEPLNGCLLLG